MPDTFNRMNVAKSHDDIVVNTIEERVNRLKCAAQDVSDAANHIHGILFGFTDDPEPLMDDKSPRTIDGALRDVESHVLEAASVLDGIAEALSSSKRLKVKP